MKNAVFAISIALVGCLIGSIFSPIHGQNGGQHQISTEIITHSSDVSGKYQQLIVIDPTSRVMSVYHVEPTRGEISLKSVRNFHWDLTMSAFNTGSPKPEDIQRMHQQR